MDFSLEKQVCTIFLGQTQIFTDHFVNPYLQKRATCHSSIVILLSSHLVSLRSILSPIESESLGLTQSSFMGAWSPHSTISFLFFFLLDYTQFIYLRIYLYFIEV